MPRNKFYWLTQKSVNPIAIPIPKSKASQIKILILYYLKIDPVFDLATPNPKIKGITKNKSIDP